MTRYVLSIVVASLIVSACSDGGRDPAGPTAQPGTVTLQLEIPAGSTLGAVRLEITGGQVTSVAANGDARIFGAPVQGRYVVAAFGDLESGALGLVGIPDVGALGRYSVRVTEAADRDNALASVSGASAQLVR